MEGNYENFILGKDRETKFLRKIMRKPHADGVSFSAVDNAMYRYFVDPSGKPPGMPLMMDSELKTPSTPVKPRPELPFAPPPSLATPVKPIKSPLPPSLMVTQAKIISLHWEEKKEAVQEATLEVEFSNGDRQLFVIPILRMTDVLTGEMKKR